MCFSCSSRAFGLWAAIGAEAATRTEGFTLAWNEDDDTTLYHVVINVGRPGNWPQRVRVVMDRYTGEILYIDGPADATAGEVFTHWQRSLRSGIRHNRPPSGVL